MKELDLADVRQYVTSNIATFHKKRQDSLNRLDLAKILHRKNPYLFRVKYLLTAEQIVKGFADAHASSSEETLFGDWLEGLAIFINGKVYGGQKSGIRGIDLEFSEGGIRYIVTIKSGPNWGNSSQVRKMGEDFTAAKRTLRTSNSKLNIVAVNGCCYGQDAKPDKGEYFKYCGQAFWEFVSGDPELYTKLIAPLGHRAKKHTTSFDEAYTQAINRMTADFTQNFCKTNGSIDWQKLVKFNSQSSFHSSGPKAPLED